MKEQQRLDRNAKARQKLADNPIEEREKRARFARQWRARHPETSRKFNRARLNTGEVSSEDKVLFYGYKEPLRKFEGGFGYQGVLRYSKDKDKVECHFCGRLFRAINNGHLMKVHSLTAEEYKEKTGLAPTTALIGEGTRLKLLDRPYNPNHMEELKKSQEKRRERIKKGLPDIQSGHRISLERKNQRGTCPDQLLNMIDKTAKSLGRSPTMEEFLQVHNGRYTGSIRNTFGTWTNALSKLGLRTWHPESASEEQLIEEIRNFFQVNHRTPRWSDFKRGFLSRPSVYYSRFKTINNARLRAGVPLLIEVGRKREEWMPSKDERARMLARI